MVSYNSSDLRSSSESTFSSCTENESLKMVNKALCQELCTLQSENSSLVAVDHKLSETHKKMFSAHRNSKKKLDRREHEMNEGKITGY